MHSCFQCGHAPGAMSSKSGDVESRGTGFLSHRPSVFYMLRDRPHTPGLIHWHLGLFMNPLRSTKFFQCTSVFLPSHLPPQPCIVTYRANPYCGNKKITAKAAGSGSNARCIQFGYNTRLQLTQGCYSWSHANDQPFSSENSFCARLGYRTRAGFEPGWHLLKLT